MGNLSDQLLDELLRRAIGLLRVDASYRRDVARLLVAMQDELITRIVAADITAASRARLNALLADVQGYLATNYRTIAAMVADQAFELMQAESVFIAASINRLVGVSLVNAIADPRTLQLLTTELLIQGAPSAAWWSRQSQDLAFRFGMEMRLGLAQNETIAQLVRRIRGAPARGIPGIMPVARRNAEALVRSSVATVSNMARLETYRANADVIAGVQQLSTLDGRTTPVCVAYAGAVWDLNGEPIRGTTLPFNGGPPRHWNCRSTLIPVTKTFRELGLDRDEVAAGTRASMDGQVAADITFADWLRSKPPAFADDLLGKGRAEMWRDGKITLQQLLDGTGRELTLEELQRRFGG